MLDKIDFFFVPMHVYIDLLIVEMSMSTCRRHKSARRANFYFESLCVVHIQFNTMGDLGSNDFFYRFVMGKRQEFEVGRVHLILRVYFFF